MDTIVIFRIFTIVIFTFCIDLLVYSGLKFIFRSPKQKKIATYVHWSIPVMFFIYSIFYIAHISSIRPEYVMYRKFFNIFGLYMVIYFPKALFCVFVFFFHLLRLVKAICKKKATNFSCNITSKKKRKPILLTIGTIVSTLLMFGLVYGIIYGRYDYKVEKHIIKHDQLPSSFDGLRVVQISDLHLGSFPSTKKLIKAFLKINELQPDLIVLTGDLVNNSAVEAFPYIQQFRALKADYGKYAVLGNHDMGDYRKWYSEKHKYINLLRLDSAYQEMGFELLNNEHEYIKIGKDSIAIIGVKNWGLPPFKSYGDLDQAMKGVSKRDFKIFLSHDPTHWAEKILGKTNIQVTLSGHTHGMQMGINLPSLKWSPISLKYKHWNGLYKETGQFLYVNRGLGFLGYPGRLGMTPEITLLILKKS